MTDKIPIKVSNIVFNISLEEIFKIPHLRTKYILNNMFKIQIDPHNFIDILSFIDRGYSTLKQIEIDALDYLGIKYEIDKDNVYIKNECSICLDNLNDNFMYTDCGHVYHTDCVLRWKKIKNSCPLCSKKIVEYDPHQHLKEVESTKNSQYLYDKGVIVVKDKTFYDLKNFITKNISSCCLIKQTLYNQSYFGAHCKIEFEHKTDIINDIFIHITLKKKYLNKLTKKFIKKIINYIEFTIDGCVFLQYDNIFMKCYNSLNSLKPEYYYTDNNIIIPIKLSLMEYIPLFLLKHCQIGINVVFNDMESMLTNENFNNHMIETVTISYNGLNLNNKSICDYHRYHNYNKVLDIKVNHIISHKTEINNKHHNFELPYYPYMLNNSCDIIFCLESSDDYKIEELKILQQGGNILQTYSGSTLQIVNPYSHNLSILNNNIYYVHIFPNTCGDREGRYLNQKMEILLKLNKFPVCPEEKKITMHTYIQSEREGYIMNGILNYRYST
jgi:hypothetical protein